jgi:hypothetical protein
MTRPCLWAIILERVESVPLAAARSREQHAGGRKNGQARHIGQDGCHKYEIAEWGRTAATCEDDV